MKKIIMVLIAFTLMAGVFAYEPKKECAKVKRNGSVVYYEKTVPYDRDGCKPDPKYSRKTIRDCNRWVIRKGYTVEQLVDYRYSLLESFRQDYEFWMNRIENPEVTSLTKIAVDFTNEINGTSETYKEHAANRAREYAWYEKRTAVLSIPYITVDNFLTLTKEEMLARMLDFVEEVKVENK